MVVVLLSSCGIKGLYVHTICNIGPDCYAYEFCNDGVFRYKFYQESLGLGIIEGTWSKNGDTINLNIEKRKNNLVSCIKTYNKPGQANKKMRAFVVSTLMDTSNYNGPVRINNGDWKATDLFGSLLLPDDLVYSITFRNEGNYQFKDTTFLLHDSNINYIEVYLTEKEKWNVIEESMAKKFIKKGFRLYPVTNFQNVDLKQKVYYKKIKFSCNNLVSK
jgi:hypothetical protein